MLRTGLGSWGLGGKMRPRHRERVEEELLLGQRAGGGRRGGARRSNEAGWSRGAWGAARDAGTVPRHLQERAGAAWDRGQGGGSGPLGVTALLVCGLPG